MPSLRVYSEMATHDDATAPSALALLRGREVELVLAVRPWHVAGLGEVVRRVAGEGVALSLWPMLSDEDGRFLHAGNVARMRALVTRVLAAAMPSASALKPEPRLDVMLDLEPPVDTLRALAHWRLGPAALAAAAAFAASERNDRAARALVTDIQRAGATVSVAVMPHVVLPGGRALSRLAAVPTLAGTDSVDLMLYRTLAQGYARGLVSRQRALRWLGHPLKPRCQRGHAHRARLRRHGRLGRRGDVFESGRPGRRRSRREGTGRHRLRAL
ncbi:MAG: hypothetical protein IPG50_37120 [Myxococcales bacterium]|nr:hypothetical protein [Myxococcales bacterium]